MMNAIIGYVEPLEYLMSIDTSSWSCDQIHACHDSDMHVDYACIVATMDMACRGGWDLSRWHYSMTREGERSASSLPGMGVTNGLMVSYSSNFDNYILFDVLVYACCSTSAATINNCTNHGPIMSIKLFVCVWKLLS